MSSSSDFSQFDTGAFGSWNRNYSRFSASFPNPFFDYASTQMPTSIYDILRWAEYFWLTDATYRTAMSRVVSYFLTDIELLDASDDEKTKYRDFLNDELHIRDVLRSIGDCYMAYGNAFVSLQVPFRRHLRCPKCNTEYPITKVPYTWHSEKLQFSATCLNKDHCTYQGPMQRVDRRSIGQDPLRIMLWTPHDMRILHNPISGKSVYFWQMLQPFRADLRRGTPFHLENTPWELIETAVADDRHLFRFADDYIYHVIDDTLPGVKQTGWGVPRMMSSFKLAWYLQVLKRYNEAFALDYIVPMRMLTPTTGTTGADPLMTMSMQMFNQRVINMIRQHRRDPTHIGLLPFPVNYQTLGAEGKMLAPHELLESGMAEFLNGMGVPAELYRGTLQVNAIGPALRLFERTWTSLVQNLNTTLQWIVDEVSSLMNWEKVKVRLQPITLADDIERKQLQLQLAAGQQISRQTAYAPLGINFREEVRRMFEEEQWYQEQSTRFQEEAAQRQELQARIQTGAQGGLPPSGVPAQGMQAGGAMMPVDANGMPMQPSAIDTALQQMQGGQVTPEDMMASAEQIAYELLGKPFELRKSDMLKIKKANETLHALVVQQMEKIRNSAKQQGGFQMLQQQLGPGAGM